MNEQILMQDLEKWQQVLRELLPTTQINVNVIYENLKQGNIIGILKYIWQEILQQTIVWVNAEKKILLWLILLSVFSALLGYLTDIFKQDQVAEFSFYILYLTSTSVLVTGFRNGLATANDLLQSVHLFGRLLAPSFLLTYTLAGYAVKATGIRVVLLFVLDVVEKGMIGLILPAIHIFMVLALLSCLWRQDRLGGLIRITEKTISFFLKTVLGVITSFGFLQNLLGTGVDQMSKKTVQSAISMIPGVGDLSDGSIGIIMGSANLIKNSFGVLFLILLLLLSMNPVLKLLISASVMKVAAALMELLGDKRMTVLVGRTGDAMLLLCKTTVYTILFFMISIAIACSVNLT